MAHRNRWFTYWRWWFSMAMLNNQMVIVLISWWLYGLNDGFGISHMLHGAGMSTFTPSTMAQHPFPSLETRLWWRSARKMEARPRRAEEGFWSLPLRDVKFMGSSKNPENPTTKCGETRMVQIDGLFPPMKLFPSFQVRDNFWEVGLCR